MSPHLSLVMLELRDGWWDCLFKLLPSVLSLRFNPNVKKSKTKEGDDDEPCFLNGPWCCCGGSGANEERGRRAGGRGTPYKEICMYL